MTLFYDKNDKAFALIALLAMLGGAGGSGVVDYFNPSTVPRNVATTDDLKGMREDIKRDQEESAKDLKKFVVDALDIQKQKVELEIRESEAEQRERIRAIEIHLMNQPESKFKPPGFMVH